MNKKKITAEQIIKDNNYRAQVLCHGVFFGGALLFTIVSMTKLTGEFWMILLSMAVIVGFIVVPFGYFLGLKKMCRALKMIQKVKKGDFVILIKPVLDKTMVHADNTNRYCELVFDKEFSAWVGRGLYDSLQVGSECYLICISSEKSINALYAKEKYELADELLPLVRTDITE